MTRVTVSCHFPRTNDIVLTKERFTILAFKMTLIRKEIYLSNLIQSNCIFDFFNIDPFTRHVNQGVISS